jgi:hypothetical protein
MRPIVLEMKLLKQVMVLSLIIYFFYTISARMEIQIQNRQSESSSRFYFQDIKFVDLIMLNVSKRRHLPGNSSRLVISIKPKSYCKYSSFRVRHIS